MRSEMGREDILSDFAMETNLTPEVLGRYIRRYPDLALELTDLFHEFTMVDLTSAEGSAVVGRGLMGAEHREGVALVHAALSGSGLRNLAHRLGLPRDFVAGFRDAKVRLGSVPSNVLLNLAQAIDVKIQYLIAYLQRELDGTRAVAFKADSKPQWMSVMEYDKFIESLDLDDDETAALERLSESSERN